MITAVTLLRRKAGMTPEEFQDYWKTRHAAVIATLPGIVRYTQSHPVAGQTGPGVAEWDGVAELRARDSQAFRDIGASDAYRMVLQDEENFLDRSATALVLTELRLRRDGDAAGGLKYLRFFRRAPGLSPEDFQAHWHDVYGPAVDELPGLMRYAQFHARPGGYRGGREPLFDGLDVTWFPDGETLGYALSSEQARAARAMEPAFLDAGEPAVLVARELTLIG